MPADADAVTVWVLGGLLAGSLQGTVLIALAWFASRGMPKLPPSWLAVLWWLAALKLLVAFVPVAAVSIPLLPAGTQPITDLAELARVDIGDAKQDTSAVGVALAEQPADATNDQTNQPTHNCTPPRGSGRSQAGRAVEGLTPAGAALSR